MKSILTLIAVFFTVYIQAQTDSLKKYVFNYKLEYNIAYYHDTLKSHKIIYYINSKSNSFFAMARPNSKGKLTLYFTDYNGRGFAGHITRDSLALIEERGLIQKVFAKYENNHKYQINNYDFFSLGDTIVNNRNFSAYLLGVQNQKKRKRKNFGIRYF